MVHLYVGGCAFGPPPPNYVRIYNPKDYHNGTTNGESLAKLETAAPDIRQEEEIFRPRSQAQEIANIGGYEGSNAVAPTGAWVEAAKNLVPPPPPPEVNKSGP